MGQETSRGCLERAGVRRAHSLLRQTNGEPEPVNRVRLARDKQGAKQTRRADSISAFCTTALYR
jgi:hypothetical protein